MTAFGIQLIPGFMVGIEWRYNNKLLVVDLGIIRLLLYYNLQKEDFL